MSFRYDSLSSGNSIQISFLGSAVIDKKHRADIVFTFEEIEFLRDMAWVAGSNQDARKQGSKGKNERVFRGKVMPMH